MGTELGLDSEVWGGLWKLSQGAEAGSQPKMPMVYISRSSCEFHLACGKSSALQCTTYHV